MILIKNNKTLRKYKKNAYTLQNISLPHLARSATSYVCVRRCFVTLYLLKADC